MLTFMNSKLRWLAKTSKTTFPKKVNPMEYPVHAHTHTHIYIYRETERNTEAFSFTLYSRLP